MRRREEDLPDPESPTPRLHMFSESPVEGMTPRSAKAHERIVQAFMRA